MDEQRKYQGFWPLPGGAEKYVDTLNNCLAFVRDNRPSEELLEDWFVQTFGVSKGSAKSYVRVVIRQSGLVERDAKGIHVLTTDGKNYVENPSNAILFQTLANNILGFGEALRIIGTTDVGLEELSQELRKMIGMGWETARQPTWRVGWLRSMKLVFKDGAKLRLTKDGQDLLNALPALPALPQVPPLPLPLPESPKENVSHSAKRLVDFLVESQHLSKDSSKFEQAIADAFAFLGFSSKQIGGAGDTDVFVEANLGDESFSIVIDGKTTAGETIPERQINWPTLQEHKEARNADFIVVIGPSFAGGDLIARAQKYGVTLVETETLIRLIGIHDKTPLSLDDLKKIFAIKGLLNLDDDCQELMAAADFYEKQQKLFPRVLESIYQLQTAGQPTHAADIRWNLNREYEQDEIRETLDLLQKWNLVKKVRDDNWVALMAPKTAVNRLRAVVDAFR